MIIDDDDDDADDDDGLLSLLLLMIMEWMIIWHSFFFFVDATWITDWMILDHFGIRDYVRSIEYWRHLEGRGELNEHQFCGSFWIQKTVTSCVAGDGKQHCKEVHKIYTP